MEEDVAAGLPKGRLADSAPPPLVGANGRRRGRRRYIYQPRFTAKPRDSSRGRRRSVSSPWSSRVWASTLPPQPREVFSSWRRDSNFAADQAGEKPSRRRTVLPARWAVERRRRRRSFGVGPSGSLGRLEEGGHAGRVSLPSSASSRPLTSRAANGLPRSSAAASVAMRCFFSRAHGGQRSQRFFLM